MTGILKLFGFILLAILILFGIWIGEYYLNCWLLQLNFFKDEVNGYSCIHILTIVTEVIITFLYIIFVITIISELLDNNYFK